MDCFIELEVSSLKPKCPWTMNACLDSLEQIQYSASPRFCSWRNSLTYGYILTICLHYHITLLSLCLFFRDVSVQSSYKDASNDRQVHREDNQAKLACTRIPNLTHSHLPFLCTTPTDYIDLIWLSFRGPDFGLPTCAVPIFSCG